ncbi:hypothetical protein [Paenibacillus vini]|uniref:DUF5643 domain-containing protein n=1 Tax=Paenibacillus vini TaxID=1476024 RepID=A0ABQ4MAI8_9BACL|nr:hypothetical protein [Paenibacillus vini]GIP52980.1 hypothetical protein J42TS3_20150 [Paenibacillus vini]
MFQNKKMVLFVSIAVVLAIILIAVLVPKGNSETNAVQNTSANPATSKAAKGNNLVGTWYSDKKDNDVLTILEDGRYASSGWLAPGRYTIEGDKISLTDTFGTTIELQIKEGGQGKELFFENEPLSHTYFTTEELAKQSQEAKKPKELTPEELNQLIAVDVLPGHWISNDGSTDLIITEDKITLNHHGIKDNKSGELEGAITVEYTYTIEEITQKSNDFRSNYFVEMVMIKPDNDFPYKINNMRIYEDSKTGKYKFTTLEFPISTSFEKK